MTLKTAENKAWNLKNSFDFTKIDLENLENGLKGLLDTLNASYFFYTERNIQAVSTWDESPINVSEYTTNIAKSSKARKGTMKWCKK